MGPRDGLVFTRGRNLLLSPSLSLLGRGCDGRSETVVSTSTGEVLTRNRAYRLLDLGLPVPSAVRGRLFKHVAYAVCFMSPNRPGERCAEHVQGGGSRVCPGTWAAARGVECPRGHWGRGQWVSPAPVRLWRLRRAEHRCGPEPAAPRGQVGGRLRRLYAALDAQLPATGEPRNLAGEPQHPPRLVCSPLCLAAPPWGSQPGSEEPAWGSPHALCTSDTG